MSFNFPKMPHSSEKDFSSIAWQRWFNDLTRKVTEASAIAWAQIDKAGSNLTDIVTRNHNDLQNIQGGAPGQEYHLTAAQLWSLSQSNTLAIPGIDGVDGEEGQPGRPGPTGATGTAGTNGTNGTNGTAGSVGLPGTDGEDGQDGTPGRCGANGLNGTNGVNGWDGEDGQDGTPGRCGANGLNGTNGVNGWDGEDGQDGMMIPGPTGATGTAGSGVSLATARAVTSLRL